VGLSQGFWLTLLSTWPYVGDFLWILALNKQRGVGRSRNCVDMLWELHLYTCFPALATKSSVHASVAPSSKTCYLPLLKKLLSNPDLVKGADVV